ncbi:MAG: hypothetical protein SZ59_C0002G0384 [candidate division TM6 bacterium GW2011_GWF2_28_16]|jgi:cell shape-determining protein MreC|nr:MAG: hypothetical protein SZ59_C0002G0384 [candidate division TM6 bacterium GW2011_GWF2_28_16]
MHQTALVQEFLDFLKNFWDKMQKLKFKLNIFLLIIFNIFFNNLFCNLQEETITEINTVSKTISSELNIINKIVIKELENILHDLEAIYNLNEKNKNINLLNKKIKNIDLKLNALEKEYPKIQDNNLFKQIKELTNILKIINSNNKQKLSTFTKTFLYLTVLAAAGTGYFVFYKNLNKKNNIL